MQVEQRLLGPVHVIHDGQERAAARERLEELADGPERLLDGNGRSWEAECRPDPLEDLRGARVAFEQRCDLAARDVMRRAAGQACRLAHGLRDRREGDAFAVREAVAGEHLPLALDVLRQLADQTCLAGPGRRDHGGDADIALFTGAPPELEELRELVLAPDQRRMQIPPDPGRAGEHLDETPRRHGLRLPLECERLDSLDRDRVSHEAQRRLAEQHLAGRGGLLEARRDVHGVAARERLSGGRVTGHDFAGIHADAHADARSVAIFDFATELAQAVAQARPRRERLAARRLRARAECRTRT